MSVKVTVQLPPGADSDKVTVQRFGSGNAEWVRVGSTLPLEVVVVDSKEETLDAA